MFPKKSDLTMFGISLYYIWYLFFPCAYLYMILTQAMNTFVYR